MHLRTTLVALAGTLVVVGVIVVVTAIDDALAADGRQLHACTGGGLGT